MVTKSSINYPLKGFNSSMQIMFVKYWFVVGEDISDHSYLLGRVSKESSTESKRRKQGWSGCSRRW